MGAHLLIGHASVERLALGFAKLDNQNNGDDNNNQDHCDNDDDGPEREGFFVLIGIVEACNFSLAS